MKKNLAGFLTTLGLHQLDEACRPIAEAFDAHPYLVGSAGERSDWRDVDVRLILSDAEFDRLFSGRRDLWGFLSSVIGQYLVARTGLPVDFQIQRQTEANEKHSKSRNPLGIRNPGLYASAGDATKFVVLMIVALILFIVAAIGVAVGRVNLIAAGLALWALAVILRGGSLALS